MFSTTSVMSSHVSWLQVGFLQVYLFPIFGYLCNVSIITYHFDEESLLSYTYPWCIHFWNICQKNFKELLIRGFSYTVFQKVCLYEIFQKLLIRGFPRWKLSKLNSTDTTTLNHPVYENSLIYIYNRGSVI